EDLRRPFEILGEADQSQTNPRFREMDAGDLSEQGSRGRSPGLTAIVRVERYGDRRPFLPRGRLFGIHPVGQLGAFAPARRTAVARNHAVAGIGKLDPRIDGIVFARLRIGSGGYRLPLQAAVRSLQHGLLGAHGEPVCGVEEPYAQDARLELADPFPTTSGLDR